MIRRITIMLISLVLILSVATACRQTVDEPEDNNIEQPQDTTDGEDTEDIPEEIDATGIYIGQIDNNSVEIEVNGETMAFRLSEELRDTLNGSLPRENTEVNFTYYRNDDNQLILRTLEWEIDAVEGTFVGFIDSNSVEINVDGEPMAFRLNEASMEYFENNDIAQGDSVSIIYEENEYGQIILNEIEKIQ